MPKPATYYVTVDEVFNSRWVGERLARIERLRAAVAHLFPRGHPTRLIQVAGTSGKGSVCRYLEAALGRDATAGAFMSPHLFDYSERFSIGGERPPYGAITDAWRDAVRPIAVDHSEHGQELTFFDASVLIALVLFERFGVEWAAVEAGVGGRYDATTALPVELCVITNVGREHEDRLGERQWQRVLDKGGVARGAPIVAGVEAGEDRALLQELAADAASPIDFLEPGDVDALARRLAEHRAGAPPDALAFQGAHQLRNAALAAKALEALAREAPADALAAVRAPGRLEQVEPGVYADVAHNPDKIEALAAALGDREAILVIGLSGARQARLVFAALDRLARHVVVTSAGARGADPEAVRRELVAGGLPPGRTEIVPEPAAALARARDVRVGTDAVIVVTGSTFTVDQALNADGRMRHLNAAFDWRDPRR